MSQTEDRKGGEGNGEDLRQGESSMSKGTVIRKSVVCDG